ncbi:glycoside hydrolase [Stereum hirsutum FP-91666 SS1]|uniref:glycoside hydrolase n=1 Tax=Stereum hirsutum (strain FP-91666) TaxID=721885 RepID=UPI000444A374|nr:glycoside hydrolase [Stereum hirsutum FP-91666 SS1]EIM81159.1 glycoside hydrolase [Stereum hirsutum FP-91666 SS1]
MMRTCNFFALGVFSLGLVKAQTTVVVNGTASHTIPSTLWGLMYEDINSGDGGLYAELLQNRAFQQVDVTNQTEAQLAWHSVNGAELEVIADSSPVSSSLPNSLQVTIPAGATGAVGVGNEGYFGINVNSSWTYNASFYYRLSSSSNATATVSLISSTSSTVFASTTASLTSTNWTQVLVSLTPSSSAGDLLNNFTVTVDGESLAGETVYFALFSLFPPTWEGQSNGMREDLAQILEDASPAFFRWPGGNNLEGQSIETRWQWNATTGSLLDRPGREGDWSYINTDGIGIYEYLIWIEKMGMQSIMAVWDGYSLDGTSVAEGDLAPYVEQARAQIEFVVGNTSTPGGALRASLGHPDPFTLNYVEVGNEDFIGEAPETVAYRWNAFYSSLSVDYPDIRFLATPDVSSPVLTPTPPSYDIHTYQIPSWFAENTDYFDDFERNGTTYFYGEYAVTSTNSSALYGTFEDGRLEYPIIGGSVSEAAFMTGLERNSDIVFAASYAPLLGHVNGSQWTPNLVNFDAGTIYPSTSYYVQRLFSLNTGDEYLPSTLPSANGTLFWTISRSNSTSEVFIKVVNTDETSSASVTFELPFAVASSGTVEVLTGSYDTSNTPETPTAAVPTESTVTFANASAGVLDYEAPSLSLSVLTLTLA